MTLTKQIQGNVEKIIFKDYFQALANDDERNKIRDIFVLKYKMGYTTFYTKVRTNGFSELEFEKLEEITKIQLAR